MVNNTNMYIYKYIIYRKKINIRFFSSQIKPIVVYNNLELDKANIFKENKNKSGVYRWVNKITNESYVGSSTNITNRLRKYFSINYLKDKILKNNSRIYKAILKHSYLNFKLEILEYCDKTLIINREQYYLDILKPDYNILKTAGSLLGFKHSSITLVKFKNRISATSYSTLIYNNENIIKEYTSVRKAAVSLGISHTTLLRYIKMNKNIKGFTIKILKPGNKQKI